MRRPSMVSLLLRAMLAGPACLFLAGCAGSPEGALTGLLADAGDPSSERPAQTAPADGGANVQAPALAFADGESMLDRARRIAAAKGLGRPLAESPPTDAAGPLANPPVSAMPVAAMLAQRVADAGALRAEPSPVAEGLDIAEANARIRAAAERLRAERASGQDLYASAGKLRAEPRSGAADDPRELFRRAVALARARALEAQRQAFGGLADLAPAVADPPAPSYFMQAIRMRQADAGALQPLGLAR